MIGKAKYYIISNYFKYFFLNLIIFLTLIWISQILRIIEFQYSFSSQLVEVAISTLLALPSFINPLVPFLILIGSFFLNYKFNFSNEILIVKQYLPKEKLRNIHLLVIILTSTLYFLNNEFFSKNLYEKYKLKELEIRNNLKLGSPSQNEFHIDNIISLFFLDKEDDVFYDVQAIIYQDNQFISANSAQIELSKLNFNLVFYSGESLVLNEKENSKSQFDKFIYTLQNKKYEILLMDKEHYNTLELIRHQSNDFRFEGHNNIFHYFFLFFVIYISLNVTFLNNGKVNNYIKFTLIFLVILMIQIFNSYLIYLLNYHDFLNLIYYYLILSIVLAVSYLFVKKIIK